MILLPENTNKENWLIFASLKWLWVLSLVLAEERYVFENCFDGAYSIDRDLQLRLSNHISLTIFTDSDSLFKITLKLTITIEKRLKIEIKAAKNGSVRSEILDIG